MKLTELSFRTTIPFASISPFGKPCHSLRTISSKQSKQDNGNPTTITILKPKSSSHSPWLSRWPSQTPQSQSKSRILVSRGKTQPETRNSNGGNHTTAVERIVLRLRNLGVGTDDEEEDDDVGDEDSPMPATGQEKLGDLLRRDWVRPDTILDDDSDDDESVFPWERKEVFMNTDTEELNFVKKRPVRAPSLAELTMEDDELRRLRRDGMTLRERISVAKAGVTGAILEKIHDQWRKSELVRLKFHETLARDMRTAHEIVERRSGGLVIWRSGSVMVVYRGTNYSGPISRSRSIDGERDNLFVPEASADDKPSTSSGNASDLAHERRMRSVLASSVKSMTEEEKEINSLLDELGPRFDDWWGTGVLPVDADLLPQTINGYKTPFRLLPNNMRPRLTNAEMTDLRKVAKRLPCHFALGRNRNHQGLASAIVKLWEKSVVAKIAVKRGVQNTNNELMAEEIKRLTGGILLLRNKYYIVIYRGKDFVPTTVASALAERQELTKEIQDNEEKMRRRETLPLTAVAEENIEVTSKNGQVALAGTLAEFYQAQAQWGREKTAEEHEKMLEAASRTKTVRVVKRLEHKLFIAQAKKNKAEKELAKIRESWLPSGPPEDLETITDEERVMFRRVGLKMKAYLPLGIRGVFDGVIENMHLHWKHRELVKLLSKQKDQAFVEETARLLEFESGGILVDIVRVSKGYAVMYYRGKNYQRPISIRPRSLPTKARALKRWKALQRYEALSQHITELESAIAQMNIDDGGSGEAENFKEDDEFNSESEDEMESDGDENEDSDWEDDDGNDDDS